MYLLIPNNRDFTLLSTILYPVTLTPKNYPWPMDALVTQWCNTFQNRFTFKKYIEEKRLTWTVIRLHVNTSSYSKPRWSHVLCGWPLEGFEDHLQNPLQGSCRLSARTSCEMQSPESTYYIIVILSCCTDGTILFYLIYVQGTELELITQACWRQTSSSCSHTIVGYRERERLFYIQCPRCNVNTAFTNEIEKVWELRLQ